MLFVVIKLAFLFPEDGLLTTLKLFFKAARCDCCKTQGTLKEKVQWRGEMKHFCDQHCLLRFYCQQNEPNMATQKGPENLHYGMYVCNRSPLDG